MRRDHRPIAQRGTLEIRMGCTTRILCTQDLKVHQPCELTYNDDLVRLKALHAPFHLSSTVSPLRALQCSASIFSYWRMHITSEKVYGDMERIRPLFAFFVCVWKGRSFIWKIKISVYSLYFFFQNHNSWAKAISVSIKKKGWRKIVDF